MKTLITIAPHNAHLWLAKLSDFTIAEQSLLALLSPDEAERALRFHFPLHRQRFIIVRGLLRKTINLYTGIEPEKITLSFGRHGKPYLQNNPLNLQFNVSHSDNLAVFALTIQQEIGVDIEKMEPYFNKAVAKRFFSPQEYTQLMALSTDERIKGFYQIWTKREAIIKALGEGLFTSSADFSVSLRQTKESIMVIHLKHEYSYHVESFLVPNDYQAAFSTLEPIENIVYKKW